MKLFSNESVLSVSDDHSLHLTNIRIRYNTKKEANSMFLENIQTVNVRHSSILLFMVLGCLCIVFSLLILLNPNISPDEKLPAAGTGIIFGGLLLFAYLLSRKHYLIISAAGGKPVYLVIKGQGKAKIQDFITLLEEAIYRRKQDLYSR